LFLGFKESVNDIQPIFLDIILNKLSLPISHFYFQYIFIYSIGYIKKKKISLNILKLFILLILIV